MCSRIVGILMLLGTGSALAADPDRRQLDFFEKKIRPVLVEHCYECHAADAKKIQGGLLVDSRKGLFNGGDSGPAVVSGDVDESLLVAALRYDSFEMPPKGKLPDTVIADFEQWIRDGAVDPRRSDERAAPPTEIDIEAGRAHWAYQPLAAPPVPDVKNRAWPAGEFDRFILAKLEADGLKPVADAEEIVLVRRLYFDLIGLPPTPEQIDEFVNDNAPQAYERLVDRLLVSPRFGERWGRHWLDVVRYAESVTLRGILLKHAWRYRDYVIEAFNDDRPFDRFLTEQLAGDLLEESSIDVQRRSLIATAFLMMGNANLEDQDKAKLEMDFVDEQLDVIGRGLLGQTITCARCHDHKFDPIPTRDYYALAGILKNVQALNHSNISKCVEVPLPVDGDLKRELELHQQAVADLESSIAQLKQELGVDAAKNSAGQALRAVAVADLPGIVVDDADARKVGEWQDSQYNKLYVGRGYIHDLSQGKGEKSLSFIAELPADGEYEVRLACPHGTNRPTNVPVTVFSADGEKTIVVDQRRPPPIDGLFVSLGTFRFEAGGQSFVIVSNKGTSGAVIGDAVQFLPADEANKLVASKKQAEVEAQKEQAKPDAVDKERAKRQLAKKKAELTALRKKTPSTPMAMSVVEGRRGEDLKIHIRGSTRNLGDVVPRGVLRVATYGDPPEMPADGSGRLELARWMVDPQNPLTSRVIVNRVWHWLLGAGLVRTVDNFGATGELPSHGDLLDHLAVQFVREGWSVKRLIRTIVLSRTYRLSSTPAGRNGDPENRLLSHMNRRRLDAESLRDAMLSAAGTLDLAMGGTTFPPNLSSDYNFTFNEPRRSVYVPVFRNSLPELFDVFDFANPSLVTGRRNVSTVAPQALFLMNHPFVRTQAQRTAERLLRETHDDEKTRIDRAYRLTLGRPATASEMELSGAYLQSLSTDAKKTQVEAWTQVVQSLFSTIDFRYLR